MVVLMNVSQQRGPHGAPMGTKMVPFWGVKEGDTEKCRVLEWGTHRVVEIQSHKSQQDPEGSANQERLGMELVPGTGSPAWLLVSPPLGKGHSVPSVTLHQPAGGRCPDNVCWKAGQVDAGIDAQPDFRCSSAACVHRLAGSVSTLRGKGSRSQPIGVTGCLRWTRMHDHWQNWRELVDDSLHESNWSFISCGQGS